MSPRDYKNSIQGLKNKRVYKACLRLLRSNHLIEMNDLRWNPYFWTNEQKKRYIQLSNVVVPVYNRKIEEFQNSNPKKSKKYEDLLFKRINTHERFAKKVYANKIPKDNSLYESI